MSGWRSVGVALGGVCVAHCVLSEQRHTRPRFGVVLYSSHLSPFCGVVEAFLAVEGIEHETREVDPYKKKRLLPAEIEGVEKAEKRRLPPAEAERKILPLLEVEGVARVEKAQEIVDFCQLSLLDGRGRIPNFTNAEKNFCMTRLNARLLPLMGLNRHLTYASSKEALHYLRDFRDEWGYFYTRWMELVLPIIYWRQWRRMAYSVLDQLGFANVHPLQALCDELERVQEERGSNAFFGGRTANMVDVWLFGQLSTFKGESLFRNIEEHCPKTMDWFKRASSEFVLMRPSPNKYSALT